MYTYETAPDRFISVGHINFAYRRLGQNHGVPLLMCMHYRGTMDHWDPALINPLAAKRPILLVDNACVGRTEEDQVPLAYAAWAKHYLDVVRALGIDQIDVLGFSMGGCAAQMMALDAPDLVRSLVLCGTVPSFGEGVARADPGPFTSLKKASTPEEHRSAFLDGMFAASETSRAAGLAAWERITNARSNRVDYVGREGARRQGLAFNNFMDPKLAGDGSYNRFKELRMPILIANGSDDLLLPTENSYLMYKLAPNAQLHLYPDSGHGFLWQYAEQFSRLVNDFLDSSGNSKLSRL